MDTTPTPATPTGPHPVPGTMLAVGHDRYGPPEVLRPIRVPRPVAGTDEVVVRVHAVAVERAAAHMRAADPPIARLATGLRRPRDPVPGSGLAGEVVAVGPGVRDVAVGDRVVAVSMRGGGYAEEVRLPAAAVVAVPAEVTSGRT